MDSSLKKHLNDINEERLLNYQKEHFEYFARARWIYLGVNCFNQFVVKDKDGKKYIFNKPSLAIEKYKSLLENN